MTRFRFVSGLVFFVVLISLIQPPSVVASDKYFYGHPTVCSIVSKRINVREKPDVNSTVVGKLYPDNCGQYAGKGKLPYPLPQWVEIEQEDVSGNIRWHGFVASASLNTGQPYLEAFPIPS